MKLIMIEMIVKGGNVSRYFTHGLIGCRIQASDGGLDAQTFNKEF